MMEPGQLCLVNYGEVPPLYHVRLLLAPTSVDCWMVLTPDMDSYEEQMSPRNTDLTDFIYLGSHAHIPRHIPANQVYGFAPMDPGSLARHLADGRVAANIIRAGLGMAPLAAGGPAPLPAAPAPPAPIAPAAPPGALGGAGAVPVVAGAGIADVWVAMEDSAGRKKGEIICEDPNPLPVGHVLMGNKALVPGPGGADACFVKKVSRAEVARYALDDLRILPVVFDGQGVRRREFSDAVASMKDGVPQGGGLQLDGPTSSLNLVKSMRDQNLTPTTFHEYWLRSAEIPKGDRSTYEHECLGRILESLITVDQLNICALQGAELICRRLQVIREAHRISPSSPDYSSADHFMGWKWRRSAQGVDMQLASHVAQALKDEAAIAKEARKAREEQSMRRKNPGKGAQGGGGGDQK